MLANCMKFAELEYLFVKNATNADFRASSWGAGWKFGAPHAQFSSNPAQFTAGFGREGRQRLEIL
jgi:hypothetical protein